MANVTDVAKYFLALAEAEDDVVSNLKLQKLVYYAQGFHLAMRGEPLFTDRIKAWNHGPVVPDLWHKYKDYGANSIPRDPDFDASVLTDEERELIEEVHGVYGQYSAWKLRNMTHAEPPWQSAANGQAISTKLMRDYFKTRIRA